MHQDKPLVVVLFHKGHFQRIVGEYQFPDPVQIFGRRIVDQEGLPGLLQGGGDVRVLCQIRLQELLQKRGGGTM